MKYYCRSKILSRWWNLFLRWIYFKWIFDFPFHWKWCLIFYWNLLNLLNRISSALEKYFEENKCDTLMSLLSTIIWYPLLVYEIKLSMLLIIKIILNNIFLLIYYYYYAAIIGLASETTNNRDVIKVLRMLWESGTSFSSVNHL